jgi:hypothetical protein
VLFHGDVRARSKRLIAVALGLAAVASAGCTRAGDSPPSVVTEYLRALRGGDLRTAYDLTRFGELSDANPAASLTFEHFSAFYRDAPLDGYEVTFAKQIVQRSLETGAENPFYVVDVKLIQGETSVTQTWNIEGKVLPKLEIDPDFVLLAVPGKDGQSITIDGVPSPARPSGTYLTIVVIRGRHVVRVAGRETTLVTDPLSVVEGAGRIRTDSNGFQFVDLR